MRLLPDLPLAIHTSTHEPLPIAREGMSATVYVCYMQSLQLLIKVDVRVAKLVNQHFHDMSCSTAALSCPGDPFHHYCVLRVCPSFAHCHTVGGVHMHDMFTV